MLTTEQNHQIAKSLAHVLHAEERAEYVRAALARGDSFTAAEDCQRLIDELFDAKTELTALDLEVNPPASTECEPDEVDEASWLDSNGAFDLYVADRNDERPDENTIIAAGHDGW